jgi:replicative DNA helicase
MAQPITPLRDEWAEERILVTLLEEPASVSTVIDALGTEPDVFTNMGDQLLYDAVVSIHTEGGVADYLSVASHLKAQGKLARAGGAFRLRHLYGIPTVSSADNLNYYIGQMVSTFQRRRIQRLSEEAWVAASEGKKVSNVVEDMHSAMEDLHRAAATDDTQVAGYYDALYEKLSNPEIEYGIPLRPEALAENVPHMNPGDLIIVAGNTSVGKSALAMNMAWKSCRPKNLPVLYLSLEMTEEQVTQRLSAMLSGVSLGRLTNPKAMEQEHFAALGPIASEFEQMPFHIVYEPSLSIEEAMNIARLYHNRYNGLGCVVLDYLQYMRADTNTNRNEEISRYSVRMKSLAGNLGTSCIVVSQLNRQSSGGTPELSHLRDSGSIEQDADVVVMIEKPYEDDEDVDRGDMRDMTVHVRKNRQGKVGPVEMTFHPSRMRWSNPSGAF